MLHDLHIVFEALFGDAKGRRIVRDSRRQKKNLKKRLENFEKRFGTEASPRSDEAPIFIFSAGWRSGSTLLQRMLMAHNPNILIWGEPYDRSNIFDRMLDQFRCITDDWPLDEFFKPIGADVDLVNQWVANLYPDAHQMRNAHLQFFDTLFSQTAKKAGYMNWGVKEVRLNSEHALYLKWLYPKAKFLMLYRNPLDAYRSYRKKRYWFRSWPDKPILTPYAFGRNWVELTSDFLNRPNPEESIVLRYEDLDDSDTVKKASEYLGWKIEPSSHFARIGSSIVGKDKIWVPTIEVLLLKAALGNKAKRAGYSCGS